MDKINFNFEDVFLLLKYQSKEFLFNYNNIYIFNLENPYNFEHLKNLESIKTYNNFIIFSYQFRDNIEIIQELKKKFNLKFVEFCLECFWCLSVFDGKFDENIYLGDSNYEIKIKSENYILNIEEMEIKVNLLKKKFEEYKRKIASESLEKLVKSYNEINKYISMIRDYSLKTNNNLIISSKIKFNKEYVEKKRNIWKEQEIF